MAVPYNRYVPSVSTDNKSNENKRKFQASSDEETMSTKLPKDEQDERNEHPTDLWRINYPELNLQEEVRTSLSWDTPNTGIPLCGFGLAGESSFMNNLTTTLQNDDNIMHSYSESPIENSSEERFFAFNEEPTLTPDRVRRKGGQNYQRTEKFWETTLRGLTKQSENRIGYLTDKICKCLQRMINRIQKLKGFDRLYVLGTFLDAFTFGIPLNTIYKDISNIKTPCMVYEDLDHIKSAIDKRHMHSTCKSLVHVVRHAEMYSSDDFIEKLMAAARRDDAWYIESLLHMASPNIMKRICWELCTTHPEKNLLSQVVVNTIKRKFLKTYGKKFTISQIWTGSNAQRILFEHRGIDTVVVITGTPISEDLGKTFWGLTLITRTRNECNAEAESLLCFETGERLFNENVSLDSKDFENIFIKHSNITLINTSSVHSKGYMTEHRRIVREPAVVIYCQIKGVVPIGEELFPRNINGVTVDVREGTCTFAANPLKFAEEIGTESTGKTGTIGGFVDLQNPNRKAFITCAHVVLPTNILKDNKNDSFIRRQEVCVFDKTLKKVGEVSKAVFNHGQSSDTTVDAALVEITDRDRDPCEGYFADVYPREQLLGCGFSAQNLPHFSSGQIDLITEHNFRLPILKVGASSGITLGSLKIGTSSAQIIDDLSVTVDNSFQIKLFGQLEVIPRIDPSQPSGPHQAFLNDGDSGAFVFIITNDNPLVLKCIGMAIAKTSYGSCLLTPIKKIFDKLGLPHDCLSNFSVQRDNDSDSLRNMMFLISQQLKEVKLTMDANVAETKKDREQLKIELVRINSRLTMAESDILSIKRSGK